MLPEDGEPTVLEINTIPGMTEASLLPEAAGVAGISYPELCARIIELSRAATEAREMRCAANESQPRARNQRVSNSRAAPAAAFARRESALAQSDAASQQPHRRGRFENRSLRCSCFGA